VIREWREQREQHRQAEIDAVITEFGGDTDAPAALTRMAEAMLSYRHWLRQLVDAGEMIREGKPFIVMGPRAALDAGSAEAMAAALILRGSGRRFLFRRRECDMLGPSFRQVNSMDIQNLSPEVQARWDVWLEHRVVQLRDAVGDALGETRKEIRKQHDDDMAKLRQEMRDSPPLFSAPDRRLAAAMTRVGEELHAQKEGINALRATATEYVKRVDLGGIRLRLERRIGELERQNESIELGENGGDVKLGRCERRFPADVRSLC
jgi:hypothetical protein